MEKECREIISPRELKNKLPLSPKAEENIAMFRGAIEKIQEGNDKRKIFIVGPCSIHSPSEAQEYAQKLKQVHEKVKDKIFLIMRVYFEKPRSSVGWKGFINDPDLNESFNIEKGLFESRKLLLRLAELGVPAATELLYPLHAVYIEDLLSWAAIGARTTESQIHRELASFQKMPLGFKNSTSGDIQSAASSIKSSSFPHSFLGISNSGKISHINSNGNKHCHLILRGGSAPNYSEQEIKKAREILEKEGISKKLIIDCSHANSQKNEANQEAVLKSVIGQINNGDSDIMGIMLESNLESGKQSLSFPLKKGVSITDSCIGWDTTEKIIIQAYNSL